MSALGGMGGMSGASDMDLKRKIAMLEAENKNLKESAQGGAGEAQGRHGLRDAEA